MVRHTLNMMVGALCAALFVTTPTAPRAAGTDPLVVGMELAYPPFEMTDTRGTPTGVSVDLANEFGKYLREKVVIQNLAFDGLIPALKTGKIDLIIAEGGWLQRARSGALPTFGHGLELRKNAAG